MKTDCVRVAKAEHQLTHLNAGRGRPRPRPEPRPGLAPENTELSRFALNADVDVRVPGINGRRRQKYFLTKLTLISRRVHHEIHLLKRWIFTFPKNFDRR